MGLKHAIAYLIIAAFIGAAILVPLMMQRTRRSARRSSRQRIDLTSERDVDSGPL